MVGRERLESQAQCYDLLTCVYRRDFTDSGLIDAIPHTDQRVLLSVLDIQYISSLNNYRQPQHEVDRHLPYKGFLRH